MAVIHNNRILKYLLMMVVSLLLVLNFSIGVSASSGYDRQEADACITISERLSVKGGSGYVNIDTGTANAFISQDSPIRHQLKNYVSGKQMVMTETAMGEFKNIVNGVAGDMEKARAERFLKRVKIIPDAPSSRALNLNVTKKVGVNDIIIFGTGDNLNIVTMTSDAKFVRGASAQGVDFDVFIHTPTPLMGR